MEIMEDYESYGELWKIMVKYEKKNKLCKNT